MTTDSQAIKARLAEVAADARYAYGVAIEAITELQAELDDYKQSPGVRAEHYRQKAAKAEAERDKLANRVDELRHQVGRVTRERDEWEANAESALEDTPRVITADELEPKMWVATKIQSGQWITGTVHHTRGEAGFSLILPDKRFENFDAKQSIVLLADAPAEQQEPEAEKPGYQKFYDSIGATDLLHHPDPAPVTAETIRASEPGSTWEDRDGDTWEWDGKHMRFHKADGKVSDPAAQDSPELALGCHGPFTRSTAAPRGDYEKHARCDAEWNHARRTVAIEIADHQGWNWEVLSPEERDEFHDLAEGIMHSLGFKREGE